MSCNSAGYGKEFNQIVLAARRVIEVTVEPVKKVGLGMSTCAVAWARVQRGSLEWAPLIILKCLPLRIL